MTAKGRPRDLGKWGEVLHDANARFPNESGEYRRARDELLLAEAELRRLTEEVAAQRRALPVGGLLKEDYVFESAADGDVRFSELFAPGRDTLVIYNMMFPRWSEDARAPYPGGRTSLLPLVEQPCPSCTSVVDGFDGPAPHINERVNLVVVAKASAPRLDGYAKERGWRHVRLLSSRDNTYNRDYHGESAKGEQVPILNVFSRDEDGIHHRWGSELMFGGGDSRHLDPIWPIWGLLDLTPHGRGSTAAYPSGQYE